MEQKSSLIFSKTLEKQINEFCVINEIKDVDSFKLTCFKKGFDIERYGTLGKNKPSEIIKYVDREIFIEKDNTEDIKKITELELKVNQLNEELQKNKDSYQPDARTEKLIKSLQDMRIQSDEKNKIIKQQEEKIAELLEILNQKPAIFHPSSNLSRKL